MQSRARIVIVEDNPADALLIVDELRKHSDKYEIEVLRDGAEALRFVRGQGAEPITDVCVLVIDVNLPKYDPKLANLRVIVLTGVATPGEESAVMDLGVRLYRGKPIHYDGFVQLAGEIAGICDENGSTMTAAG
jgi:CheY-like chemotaxis protein